MPISARILVLALLAGGLAHAQAYRWVDEDGIVHYSDRPHEGAEFIQLPHDSRPRTAVARTPSERPARPSEEPEQPPDGYRSLAVSSPGPEETLWNLEGTLNVTLDLQPALQPGHRVRVYFDGQPRMESGTSFQLEEVYRGTHNLQAEVLDSTGKLLIRSQTIRFYVQQTSVVNPNRPPRPRPTPRR